MKNGCLDNTLILLSLIQKTVLTVLTGILFLPFISAAGDRGFPSIKYFTPDGYEINPKNAHILADDRNFMLVTTKNGILEFDGAEWNLLEELGGDAVYCLNKDNEGRIHIGKFGQFGPMKLSPEGRWQYTSRKDQLPEKLQNQLFLKVVEIEGNYYYKTITGVFLWSNEGYTRYWDLGVPLTHMFVHDGTLYVTNDTFGTKRLVNGNFVEWKESEHYINWKLIESSCSFDHGLSLVCSHSSRLHLFDGTRFTAFPSHLDQLDSSIKTTALLRLENGQILVATNRMGLFILDQNGDLILNLNKTNGLLDNSVYTLFEDNSGGIWLLQNHGIVRIEYSTPQNFYDERLGLEGHVLSVVRHNGKLYAGTTLGLYRMEESETDALSRFVLIKEVEWECRSLISTEAGLLIGTTVGLFCMKDEGETVHSITTLDASYLFRSQYNPSFVFIGSYRGLGFLEINRDKIMDYRQIVEVEEAVHGITEDRPGSLWLKTGVGDTSRLLYSTDHRNHSFEVRHFNTDNGLPDSWVSPVVANNQLLFTGSGNLYSYEETKDRFEINGRYDYFPFSATHEFIEIVQDPNENLWVSLSAQNGNLVPKPAGLYYWGLQYLCQAKMARAEVLYMETDGMIWMGSIRGLMSYDLKQDKPDVFDLQTHIRRVVCLDNDRFICGSGHQSEAQQITLPYDERNLQFTFSAPEFKEPKRLNYQYFLDGFDKKWSVWNPKNVTSYTNLSPGKYRFKVQAIDAVGRGAKTADVYFEILPPWYKGRMAYTGYAILFTMIFIVSLSWGSSRWHKFIGLLKSEMKTRMDTLERRTRELKEKDETVIHLQRDLAETRKLMETTRESMQQQYQAQIEFLADMGHDIRTPMNGVIGMASLLAETPLSQDQHHYLNLIRSSGEMLLNLVNNIIDYTKLIAGRIQLEPIPFDLSSLIEDVIEFSAPRLLRKSIHLIYYIPPELETRVLGDGRKFRQILLNILNHSIRFTEQGEIVLSFSSVNLEHDKMEIRCSIQDTGKGISEENFQKIQNIGKSCDRDKTGSMSGTDLGLLISKHLVELMGGKLSIAGDKNTGTIFSFSLNLRKQDPTAGPDRVIYTGKKLLIHVKNLRQSEILHKYTQNRGFDSEEIREWSDLENRLRYDKSPIVAITEAERDNLLELRKLTEERNSTGMPPVCILNLDSSLQDSDGMDVERPEGQSCLVQIKKPVCYSILESIWKEHLLDSINDYQVPDPNFEKDSPVKKKPSADESPVVLLVEDNEDNTRVAELLLQRLGYQSEVAGDGIEALACLSSRTYEFVLMDIHMPEMDGWEATEKIRKQFPIEQQPYIVALTAAASNQDRIRSFQAGMDDYITKPVSIRDLKEAIARFKTIKKATKVP